MSETEAKQMVERLISSAMTAAMLNLPPVVAAAVYQRLEKAAVIAALLQSNP